MQCVKSRGFTDHEMLDNVGLVHMNGRVYDPGLGRFLSVDPVFQFPENTQSLNPYSYVLNTPLTMTDPTGLASSGLNLPGSGGAAQSCALDRERCTDRYRDPRRVTELDGNGSDGGETSEPDETDEQSEPDALLTLEVRSFHPEDSFGITGLGYDGDLRGFSDRAGENSRIRQEVVVNLETGQLERVTTKSDPSTHPFGALLESDYNDVGAAPAGSAHVVSNSKSGDVRTIVIRAQYSGDNDGVPLPGFVVPDINVSTQFTIAYDSATQQVSVSATMMSDGFPNAEILARSASGQTVMLGTYVRSGSALTSLWGDEQQVSIVGQVTVQLAPGGAFANRASSFPLNSTIKGYSLYEWNKVHTSRNPNEQGN